MAQEETRNARYQNRHKDLLLCRFQTHKTINCSKSITSRIIYHHDVDHYFIIFYHSSIIQIAANDGSKSIIADVLLFFLGMSRHYRPTLVTVQYVFCWGFFMLIDIWECDQVESKTSAVFFVFSF